MIENKFLNLSVKWLGGYHAFGRLLALIPLFVVPVVRRISRRGISTLTTTLLSSRPTSPESLGL